MHISTRPQCCAIWFPLCGNRTYEGGNINLFVCWLKLLWMVHIIHIQDQNHVFSQFSMFFSWISRCVALASEWRCWKWCWAREWFKICYCKLLRGCCDREWVLLIHVQDILTSRTINGESHSIDSDQRGIRHGLHGAKRNSIRSNQFDSINHKLIYWDVYFFC